MRGFRHLMSKLMSHAGYMRLQLVNNATPEFTDNFGPSPAFGDSPGLPPPPLHQPPIDIPKPSRFLKCLQQRVRSLLPFNLHQVALLYASTASPCGNPGPSWTFPIIPASTLVSRHPVDLPLLRSSKTRHPKSHPFISSVLTQGISREQYYLQR